MKRWTQITIVLALVLCARFAFAQAWSPGFGIGWVRSQPFTLMGLNIYTSSLGWG